METNRDIFAMKLTSRPTLWLKALYQLGPTQVGLNALYQLGLRSGHYSRQLYAALTRLDDTNKRANLTLHTCLSGLPEPESILKILGDQAGKLYQQADEIVGGKIRLFGGEPVDLVLNSPDPLEEWTKYEFMDGRVGNQDIKFIWEPNRFSWACTLARAYYLSGNERYADAFWEFTERFLLSNPPYFGPNWASGQEAAIRLIALAFALQIFTQSTRTTQERIKNIARVITVHAERIPPTMVYARSQNNNHLILEALGLYTASALLPEHPFAGRWHKVGWYWLQRGFQAQIAMDGSYIQNSTNYHRLMLQAALWMYAIHNNNFRSEPIPPIIDMQLAAASTWILRLLDPESGRVPNLGHNDGANILPLSITPYEDFRPIVYATAHTFLHKDLDPIGPWCEMTKWLGGPSNPSFQPAELNSCSSGEEKIRVTDGLIHGQNSNGNNSWALFRVKHFRSRPAHADQLHLDLWWRGINLAKDPGTFQYNSTPPWDNSLTSAMVHNTVTVDGHEFMQRAGRFLYLDWAQAKLFTSHYDADNKSYTLSASHNGYRKLGITHTRQVGTFKDGHWEVEDHLDGPTGSSHTIRLHWLLPDWEYEITDLCQDMDFPGYELTLRSPRCKFTLHAGLVHHQGEATIVDKMNFQLARAGELLAGSGDVLPIAGYYSPTYGVKIPALAYILEVHGKLPITLKTKWFLPRSKSADIVIKNGQIALIERNRQGRHYFVIPGGKIEPDETPEQAAAREAKEELGLDVKIGRMVAKIWNQGRTQYYFLAEETGGVFGQMNGPEINYPPSLQKGAYQPIWMPVDELPNQPVLPELVADLVWKSHQSGWPDTPLDVPEPPPDEEK